ncbi:MAG: hypothetical protein GXP32_09345 [Kiritimatiellaeota bacterium]|nr:hypothetical protein [Kiritimatiellota bacterium]
MGLIDRFLFDDGDYELFEFLDQAIEKNKSKKYLKRLFDPYLHPHGIKELAAPREDRIAYAMINLLGSLEAGKATDRLAAVRTLHAEIMSGDKSAFRINTARVLLQIMKEIVRCHGDKERQIELIHAFRTALGGSPRAIRAELRKHHLLEMSEDWNQVSFDDHVHDANTKGRKTPSHMIMDAWIKGIRSLKVIYYNHIQPEAAGELLEAADIMGVNVRISVEFPARFAKRYIQLIWAPRGFSGSSHFLDYLGRKPVRRFMEAGIELSEYNREFTLAVLDDFNKRYLRKLNKRESLSISPITHGELEDFTGVGELSLVHLAELIHSKIAAEHGGDGESPAPNELFDDYLSQKAHPDIVYPGGFPGGETLPELLTLTPLELVERLSAISTGYRLTLNLSGVSAEDVLDLICDTSGAITHLETFNLKDHLNVETSNRAEIEELRTAINGQSVIKLKRFILGLIEKEEKSKGGGRKKRLATLTSHLENIPRILGYYAKTPLREQIGSDSTGRAWSSFGMGFAALDTLPPPARRLALRETRESRILLPHTVPVIPRKTYFPRKGNGKTLDAFFKKLRRIPYLNVFGYTSKLEWEKEEDPNIPTRQSEIITLGGTSSKTNERLEHGDDETFASVKRSWRNLNTTTQNFLKVFIGFIPAFLTFFLTKNDWWVLQYGGAVIWFAITGLRNIIQSVLGGGGGLRGSSRLSWNDLVSWGRVSDSLMFTGFSVPLLDYLVKTILLNHCFGVTVATSPITLYTIMALANGVYIFTHNVFRGLPRSAAVGNLFRSILSIPVAVLFNSLLGGLLGAYGVARVDEILQRWAAVISKAASDCVAGVIEGAADRFNNMKIRREDYALKMRQTFATFARLELLFPRKDVSKMFEDPSALVKKLSETAAELKEIMIVNALDLLHFWMYQPRARDAFEEILASLTPDERSILLLSQNVLKCEKAVSEMFVDGLVGRKFSVPLAFYLESSPRYLDDLRELMRRRQDNRKR